MREIRTISNLVVEAQVSPLEDEEQYRSLTASLVALGDQQKVKEDSLAYELYKDLKTAAPTPVVDGKPRMLHMTAIIVHEGINRNGDGFYAEDLRAAVQEKRLFKMGYAGMIDVNHDFMPVGYWYDAEYITDPVTNTGAILAKGAIWAWRFPEIADKILADQHRDGKVSVSMSCLCKNEDVTIESAENGALIFWNRNPVFIATTILFDQSPGDANARGVADEDPLQITESEKRDLVMKAAANNNKLTDMEEIMLDDFKPLLEEKLGENAEQVISSIAASFTSLEEKLDARANELEALESAKTELTEQNASLSTELEEVKLSAEELAAQNEALTARVAELEEQVSEYKAAEAAAEFERVKESRLADLSDSVRERLMARDESVRNAILDRWAKQSDDEWEITKAEHALASSETRQSDRLPGGARGSEDVNTLDKFLK